MNPEIQKAIELLKEYQSVMDRIYAFLKEKDVPLGCCASDLKVWLADQTVKDSK